MKKLFVLEGEVKNKETKEWEKQELFVIATNLVLALFSAGTFARKIIPTEKHYELNPEWG